MRPLVAPEVGTSGVISPVVEVIVEPVVEETVFTVSAM